MYLRAQPYSAYYRILIYIRVNVKHLAEGSRRPVLGPEGIRQPGTLRWIYIRSCHSDTQQSEGSSCCPTRGSHTCPPLGAV